MSYHDPARNPLPAHSPTVRSPYGTAAHPLTPKARKGPGLRFVPLFLIPTIGIGAFAIMGEHLTEGEPDITLQSGIGFATVDGTEVALVPYDRTGGSGMIESIANDMFEVRIAAVDLDSGDTLWDVQLADELVWGAAVIAAGETYAYLATDDGLTVLALADGDTVAEPGEIAGLAGAQAASGTAYAYDPGVGAVVALDVNGALHTVALDALEAAPADEATAATWSGLLYADGTVPDIGGLTSTEALLADGESTVRLEPTADGALASSLALHGAETRALGTRVYYGAAIVLDQTSPVSTAVDVDVDALMEDVLGGGEIDTAELWAGLGNTAAGAASGHVLVEHTPEPNGEAVALTVVSLDTGQVTASLDVGGRLGRAATGPAGHTVVIAAPPGGYMQSDLVIVGPEGSVVRTDLGESDFLGDLFQ
ncbi:PA2928 family protein [Glycomyces paridis]|uniref:Uncharacterized protein n=1 Tax=Glycomyces paridis TaxID=2126555 RepID=A0A4S8NVP1_9ACTN|nr:PA2928 family protein [Glycomyces paridis]THV21713.1 hypothetical protein E9998_24430 [Glycomyces paridis]